MAQMNRAGTLSVGWIPFTGSGGMALGKSLGLAKLPIAAVPKDQPSQTDRHSQFENQFVEQPLS